METISYEYEGALYVNLTNKCDCACVFCLRHNGHKGSIYADDLWLDHEPTREEALADLLSRDFSCYRELVFCGFGEPMYRTDDILWLVDELKKRASNLPPIRINTNGLADLITGRNAALELDGKVDAVSVSLNASPAEGYEAICHSRYGLQAFPAILKFTSTAVFNVPHVRMTVVSTMPKEEIDASQIEISVPRQSEIEEEEPMSGRVEYFTASKGYGFIKDAASSEKYFFHITNAPAGIAEGDRVTFELERGTRGMNAVRIVISNK